MLDFFGKDEKLDKDGILRKIQNVTEEDEVRRVYHSHFYISYWNLKYPLLMFMGFGCDF